MLRNEIYAGVKTFGKATSGRHARLIDGVAAVLSDGERPAGDVIRINAYPALLTPEEWARLQQRLDGGRRRSHRKGAVTHPLSGLCRCGACGAPMYCNVKHGHGYLVCRNRNEADFGACPTSIHARADEVLRRVLDVLRREFSGDAAARLVELAGKAEGDARAEGERSVELAGKALDGCNDRLATARRRWASAPDDLVEDCERVLRELKDEKAGLEKELADLRHEQPAPEAGGLELLERWLATCAAACATRQADNAILKELVASVTVHPPTPEPGRKRFKGAATVGKVDVDLPEELCLVLATTACDSPRSSAASGR
jgi:hypothetical protein